MTQELWTEVDCYITDLLVPADPVLDEALQASDAAGLPPHNVSPNQGKLLMLFWLIYPWLSIFPNSQLLQGFNHLIAAMNEFILLI